MHSLNVFIAHDDNHDGNQPPPFTCFSRPKLRKYGQDIGKIMAASTLIIGCLSWITKDAAFPTVKQSD